MNLQRREEIREMMHKPAGNMHEMYHDIIDMQQALSDMLAHIDTLEQTAAERVIARGAAVKPHTFAEIVNAVRDIASQYAGTEQLRERIAYALTPHFERNGGPTPDYTGDGSAWVPPKCQPIPTSGQREKDVWNDGFAHGWKAGFNDDERKPVGAPAVVVPELTPEWCDEIWRNAPRNVLTWAVIEWICKQDRERFRAIPADRVLGEGMVAVSRKALEDISRRMDEQDELFAKQQRSGKISLSEAAQLMQTASQANGPTIDYSAEDAEKELKEWREYNANERRRQRDLNNENLGIDALRANQGGAAT